jgi:hypothetical protein
MSRKRDPGSLLYLNEFILAQLPEPWDLLSTDLIADGLSHRVKMVFMDGTRNIPMEFNLYGRDKPDMQHLATVAVRKLLVEYSGK